ncbi:MAG TPA: ABC-type transport auxiliary lipoprotein family protein, partial [Candidatus Sulfotelmatobacter sp.]|nr:ABC-type transport auxiliary lipoprotein family protein [Candidatus Sulfotelmatobacter sp.]
MRLPLARGISTIVVALAIGGCLSVSPPPKSYLLSPAAPASSAPQASVAVGVGPVRIPAYLDQSSIVVRIGDGEVELST